MLAKEYGKAYNQYEDYCGKFPEQNHYRDE